MMILYISREFANCNTGTQGQFAYLWLELNSNSSQASESKPTPKQVQPEWVFMGARTYIDSSSIQPICALVHMPQGLY